MDTADIIKLSDEYTMQTYGRQPVVLAEGKGINATDTDGKKYMDFGSGIGVNSLGYCDETWVKAVTAQINMIQHTSNLYYNVPQSLLAKKLCDETGYKRVFFGNSGAEANECAIKVARKYSFDKYGKGRDKIITLVNSFHGRTLTTLSATGQDVFHNYFFPFTEGFDFAVANDIEDLKKKLDGTVCAVMFEFIQGEGGVNPLDVVYIEEVFELCKQNDILTISDEVQTGIGRTGKLLAGELYGVKADIVTLAKGLGGGLPIGACLVSECAENVLGAGSHGSTFGANPVVCAGALAVLNKVCDEQFLENVADNGDYLAGLLEDLDEVESVTGAGLMLGAELKAGNAKDIVAAALKKGLILLTAKDKIRFLPPLIITREEIDKGVEILREVLKEEIKDETLA